jgi:hypothetical protein
MILLNSKQIKGVENLENLKNLRVWRSLEDIKIGDKPVVTFELNGKEYCALMDWSQFKENLSN